MFTHPLICCSLYFYLEVNMLIFWKFWLFYIISISIQQCVFWFYLVYHYTNYDTLLRDISAMLGLNKHISVTFFHKTCKQLAEAASVSVKKRKGISSIIVLCPSQIFFDFFIQVKGLWKVWLWSMSVAQKTYTISYFLF